MILTKLQYFQFAGKPEFWTVSTPLTSPTLFIGRNSVGKSRTLNVLAGLAKIITGKSAVREGHWIVEFSQEGLQWQYELEMSDQVVKSERLVRDGQELLSRTEGGTGTIKGVSGQQSFKIPADYLAVSSKRDLEQHEFLEDLFGWAQGVRYYDFGSEMGKNILTVVMEKAGADPDIGEANQVVGVFRKGCKLFPDDFRQSVVSDMAELGFDLEDVNVEPIPNLITTEAMPGPVLGLFAKERELPIKVFQFPDMSRGMFRALSVIVLVEFACRSQAKGATIIDDIGEGLDVSRAVQLVRLLVKRASAMGAQLIMASNDRGIMNAVPAEQLCGLRRIGPNVEGIASTTHPEIFKKLRRIGLSHSDLLSADFFQQ